MEFASKTPLQTIDLHDRRFYLKMESAQPSGSFKLRGMETLLKHEYNNGSRHFVCASAGNAGYSAAYVIDQLGAELTVVVPKGSSQRIVDLIKSKNAAVIEHGDAWPQANEKALELVKEKGAFYIPPYDHPLLWKGHSSMVDEIVDQIDHKPDAVVVAVGGGGLFCGLMEGLQKAGWDDIPVICTETIGAAALNASFKAQKVITLNRIDSIAASLGASKIAQNAFDWMSTHDVRSHVVDDLTAVKACKAFHDLKNTWVEPACGTALSVMLNNDFSEFKHVLVIVCGGIGWSLEQSERYLVSWE